MEISTIKISQSDRELLSNFFGEDLGDTIDFNRLMPVVVKCHEIGLSKQKEFDSNESDLDDANGWRAWSYRHVRLSTDLINVYKNVVEFIKWHNQQKS